MDGGGGLDCGAFRALFARVADQTLRAFLFRLMNFSRSFASQTFSVFVKLSIYLKISQDSVSM
jgi:hypothetical protein